MLYKNLNIINGDCIDIMKTYKDNYFDLAIIDPPFGLGNDGGLIGGAGKNYIGKKVSPKNYKKKDWDKHPPTKSFFIELQRVSKNQIVFGANHFISLIKYDSACWLVWDKINYGKFADCELAWTSFRTAVRQFRFKWAGFLQGYGTANKETRIHPTQKPVVLYEWILKNYAEKKYKILDTHLGSGSSAIASYYFNCKEFVGIEIDEDYYNLTINRIKEKTAQIKLSL